MFQLNQDIPTTKKNFTLYLGHLTILKMTLFSITPSDIKQSPSSSKVCKFGLEKRQEDSKLTSLNTVRELFDFRCYRFIILTSSIPVGQKDFEIHAFKKKDFQRFPEKSRNLHRKKANQQYS